MEDLITDKPEGFEVPPLMEEPAAEEKTAEQPVAADEIINPE